MKNDILTAQFFRIYYTNDYDEKIGCQDGLPQAEMKKNKHFSTVEPFISDQEMMNDSSDEKTT